MASLPRPLLLLLLALGGCVVVTEISPYGLRDDDDSAGDDDDSAGDDDDSAGDDDDSVAPCDLSWLEEGVAPVSLALQIEPAFSTSCDPCHTFQELGQLDLNPGFAYDALVGVPNTLAWGSDGEALSRVAPGDPQGSYLLHKLVQCDPNDPDWGHYQSTMPPPVGETVPLTQEQINLIYTWILQGALDN